MLITFITTDVQLLAAAAQVLHKLHLTDPSGYPLPTNFEKAEPIEAHDRHDCSEGFGARFAKVIGKLMEVTMEHRHQATLLNLGCDCYKITVS